MPLPGVFLARPSVRAVVFAVVYSVDSVQCPHFYWNSFYPELTCVSLSFLGPGGIERSRLYAIELSLEN